MSKITPKNLQINSTLPPFLQRLHSQNSGNDGRSEYTVARPKKARTEEDLAEDEPVYFNETSGETWTKAEWEVREAEETKFGSEQSALEGKDGRGDGEDVGKAGEAKEEGQKKKVAEIGVGKKRKLGKVVGAEGNEEVEAKEREGTELGRIIAAAKGAVKKEGGKGEKGKAGAGKKGKKIKLSFDDD